MFIYATLASFERCGKEINKKEKDPRKKDPRNVGVDLVRVSGGQCSSWNITSSKAMMATMKPIVSSSRTSIGMSTVL